MMLTQLLVPENNARENGEKNFGVYAPTSPQPMTKSPAMLLSYG